VVSAAETSKPRFCKPRRGILVGFRVGAKGSLARAQVRVWAIAQASRPILNRHDVDQQQKFERARF
jgi:hypothetical protein